MVLEGFVKLKKLLSGILGAIIIFVIGNILPITNLYSHIIVKTHDDENKLVAFILFLEWPIYILVGFILGILTYNYFLTKSSSGR